MAKKGLFTTTPDRDGGGGGGVGVAIPVQVVKMDPAEENVADPAEMKTGEDNLALAAPLTPSPASRENRKINPKELFSAISFGSKRRGRKPSLTKCKDVESGSSEQPKRPKKKRVIRSPSSSEVKTPAMIRAEELQSSLGSEFPIFVKEMVRSHVVTCFLMGPPMPFCKLHLPKEDTKVTIEDESGEQSELKYLPEKAAFSAGWRGFAIAHKLLAGDVVVFQLVEPLKFKVYIVRAKDHNDLDGALSLVSLGTPSKQDDTGNYGSENGEMDKANKKRKFSNSLQLAIVQKKIKRTRLIKSAAKPRTGKNDSKQEAVKGIPFKDIKSFEDFHILVNNMCIDSELPDHIRFKYYELCCSQNTFVHDRLLQGLNSKLVAGVISETVNIVDAIRACKMTTSRDDFATWEKTLRSFELMGMKVGFLRARVRRLLGLAFGAEDAVKARSYAKAKAERARADEEIKKLEAKVVELKAVSDKYCADIEDLESEAECYEKKFQEQVDAPW